MINRSASKRGATPERWSGAAHLRQILRRYEAHHNQHGREVLDRMLIISEHHLRQVLGQPEKEQAAVVR